jgi:hypothetical protein
MAETHHKKQQITAALTEVRIQVQNEVSHLKRALDMKQHILGSIRNHPWEWAGSAAIYGWLLPRLPARKTRIYIHSSSQKPVKSRANEPLGKLWREVWKIFKSLIAAYVAKLVAEQAKCRKPNDLELKGQMDLKTVRQIKRNKWQK